MGVKGAEVAKGWEPGSFGRGSRPGGDRGRRDKLEPRHPEGKTCQWGSGSLVGGGIGGGDVLPLTQRISNLPEVREGPTPWEV